MQGDNLRGMYWDYKKNLIVISHNQQGIKQQAYQRRNARVTVCQGQAPFCCLMGTWCGTASRLGS